MKLRFLGHAAFLIEAQGKNILIDPFITGNPKAPIEAKDLQVDAILVTHGHGDHLGDTIQIARAQDALVIGIHELALYCQSQGVARVHGMNIGGAYSFDFGRVKMVPALHSSALVQDGKITYLGEPCGLILQVDDLTIYHAGDTALFGDMALIGEEFDIDLALVPIGDNYVMGPADALRAVQILMPKWVVPIHYDTFPMIAQDGEDFKGRVEEVSDSECILLSPGEEWTL